MKKIVLSMKLVAMLVMVLALPPAALSESINYTATYDYSNLTIGTDTLGGVTYSTVNYDGLVNGGVPGAPSLPVDYIRFSVPYNATNFTVNATTHYEVMVNIAQLVYPCQTPRLMEDTTEYQITPPNSAFYSNGLYPAQRAQVVDEGFLAGENHIVTVAVIPIAFKRQFNGLFWRNQIAEPASISIILTYQLSGTPTTSLLVRRDTVLRNEGFELTRSMVVNPDWVRENAVPDTSAYVHYHDDINPGSGYTVDTTATYLIVTTEELKHSTRRIAALKRQKGYSVKVVTMDEVLVSPYSGDGDMVLDENGNYQVAYGDDAGKLREYLRYCFHNLGTEYVLLAGTDVPYRYCYLDSTYSDSPSDLYYSDLNSNWALGDTVDRCAELFVGRILAKSDNQINNYCDKLLRYELNPGNGDTSYLKRAFFFLGRDYNYHLGYVKYKFKEARKCLRPIYPNQTYIVDSVNNYSFWPKGKDIIDTLIANPVGMAIPFNHGSSSLIRVYGPDSNGKNAYICSLDSITSFENEDRDGIDCLNNKDYPMIFYAPSCNTVPYYNSSGMSFGESFITGKDYGGPVYIGYTSDVIDVKICDILLDFSKYLANGESHLNKAYALSKSQSDLEYYDECLIHAYIGDPSVELWTDTPHEYSNISVTRTNNSITISGIDVDSTIVAYRDEDYRVGHRIASSESLTLNSVSPNSSIMLYKHNCIPYILPMFLQGKTIQKDQYVIASDVTAGFYVDNSRLPGNVIVKSGTEYEIEATGTVTLDGGFRVEKGATFAVYPSCF